MVIVVIRPSIMDIATGNDLRATEEVDETSGGRRRRQAVISYRLSIACQGTKPLSRTGIMYKRIFTFSLRGRCYIGSSFFLSLAFVVTLIIDFQLIGRR